MFVQTIINSVLQIALFSLVPFVWWLVTRKKGERFLPWLGLRRIDNAKKVALLSLCVSIVFMALSVFVLYSIRGIPSATSQFQGVGAAGIPSVIVYALFNTALSEEILFRGFLLKRLMSKFGFVVANIIQSLLFGLLHGIAFVSMTGVPSAAAIILMTGAVAFAMGYINEKKAGGSILPGLMMHSAANLFSGAISLFALI
jgi:membrane protease YdiL (CAAX protease family)